MVKVKKDKKTHDGCHRKLKIEQFEPHYQKEVKYIYAQSGCSYKKYMYHTEILAVRRLTGDTSSV